MPTLYLTDQGSRLRQGGGRLIVEKRGRELLGVPALQVERVVVFGNVQVTTQALSLLLATGIETSFLTYSGHLKGRLVPGCSKNAPLRLAQYARATDEAFGLSLAKNIVTGKLHNARAVLGRQARNHPAETLDKAIATLKSCLPAVAARESVAELLGVEGNAAAIYFGALGKTLRNAEWSFATRSRRPARDPFNALLNLGYTLAGSELTSIVEASGLDPHLGFLHGVSYGRPSLALDLLEEFRAPLVDRFTVGLVNLKVFDPADFEASEEKGFRLKPEPLKRYLSEWEKFLNASFKHSGNGDRTCFRRLFCLQTQALARAIEAGDSDGDGGYCCYRYR